MTLLELARKWLRPGVKAETGADKLERADFNRQASAVWLEYHENALWAQRKLAAGLQLTPEGLEYMEREILARKLAADAKAENLKGMEHELEILENQPADGVQLPGDDAGHGDGGRGSEAEGS